MSNTSGADIMGHKGARVERTLPGTTNARTAANRATDGLTYLVSTVEESRSLHSKTWGLDHFEEIESAVKAHRHEIGRTPMGRFGDGRRRQQGPATAAEIVETAVARFGMIGAVVDNAGIFFSKTFLASGASG